MKKILEQDLAGRGVIGQPDSPGLSALEMQQKVEEVAREVIIPALNANVEELESEYGASNIGSYGGSVQDHIDSNQNPHRVTAEQVGLGQVDNTSDLEKPISTLQQAAISEVQRAVDTLGLAVLRKDNTAPYAPTAPYHPATKQFVEQAVNSSGSMTEEQIEEVLSKIDILWDAVFAEITGNPWQLLFTDLSGVNLTSGIWNEPQSRLEC